MLPSNETRLTYIPAVAAGGSESVHNAAEVPRSSVNTATGVFCNVDNPVIFLCLYQLTVLAKALCFQAVRLSHPFIHLDRSLYRDFHEWLE